MVIRNEQAHTASETSNAVHLLAHYSRWHITLTSVRQVAVVFWCANTSYLCSACVTIQTYLLTLSLLYQVFMINSPGYFFFVLYMNMGTTRLRGRPRNRWQDEVRKDGRIVGGEGWQEKVHNREEWKKLLRTARSHRILHMPME